MTALVASFLATAITPADADDEARDPLFARWETFGAASGLPSDKVLAVATGRDVVWAGTDHGLAQLIAGETHVYDEERGLPSEVVMALALDPMSGDVWAGTTAGLARVSSGRVDSFTQLDSGLANDVVYGVAVDEGGVWIATAAGLSHFVPASATWEIFDTSNTLMHEPWCYAVSADAGVVYVAVWGGGVLVRDPRTGRFRAHRDPDGEMEIDLFRDDGLVHDVTSSVAVSGRVMWVGTYFGLSRYDGKRWRSYNQDDSGLAGDFINTLAVHEDAVWVGTDQGLSRFDSATWHTWRKVPHGSALEIRDPDGTSHTLSLGDGPASDTIYGIDVGRDGVWLATAGGLSHGITYETTRRTKRAAQSEEMSR